VPYPIGAIVQQDPRGGRLQERASSCNRSFVKLFTISQSILFVSFGNPPDALTIKARARGDGGEVDS
jgi:hypothetical protein